VSYLSQQADRIRSCTQIDVPIDKVSEPIVLIYAVLLNAKGQATTERDVHDAWVAFAEIQGKDKDGLMVPFDQLSKAAKAKDRPFVEAIQKIALEIAMDNSSSTPSEVP
jgi:hypothetical protein